MIQTNSIGSSLSPSVQGLLLVLGTAFAGSVATAAQLINGNKASLPIHTLLWAFVLCSEINYLLRPDILYPAFIFSAVWVVSTAVYAWFPGQIDPLQWPAVLVVLSGVLSFSVGCILTARRIGAGHPWFANLPGNPKTLRVLLIYCLAMVPFATYATMQLAGTFNLSPAMFAAARQAVINVQSEGGGGTVWSSSMLDKAPTIAVSIAFILLIEKNRKWLTASAFGAAAILALLGTGRGLLLLLLCGSGFIILLRAHSRSLSTVGKYVAMAGIFVLLALTFHTLLTKSETQAGAAGGRSALDVAAELTVGNFAGPLAGFNAVVENPATFSDQSNNTFALLLSPLRVVGFRYHPPPPIDPFLSVPFLVNVFTAYKSFYVDFGPLGCCLAFLVCGIISGFLFASATRGNKFAILAFCYFVYAVVISPFQNSFILLYRYAYVALFGAVYFILIPRLPPITLLGRSKRHHTNEYP